MNYTCFLFESHGPTQKMDTTERIMHQINVATTAAVVRFLSSSLRTVLPVIDTSLLSLLLVLGSYLYGQENTLIQLSRRISLLLLVEKLRPLLEPSVDFITHVQGLMVNVGIVCLVALVPEWWRRTDEGRVVSTTVIYLYANMLDFLGEIKETRLAVLTLSSALLWAVSWEQKKSNHSHLYDLALQIAAIVLTNLATQTLRDNSFSSVDASVFALVLQITLIYAASFVFEVAASTQDYLVYSVASAAQGFIVGDWWLWVVFLAGVGCAMRSWFGANVWITQCAVLVMCNVVVSATLRYIQNLAIHDTIITLKASAIVVQMVLHGVARQVHEIKKS